MIGVSDADIVRQPAHMMGGDLTGRVQRYLKKKSIRINTTLAIDYARKE